jgi:hypothetical protein
LMLLASMLLKLGFSTDRGCVSHASDVLGVCVMITSALLRTETEQNTYLGVFVSGLGTLCSCQAGVCNTDNLEIANTDLVIISLNKPDHCHQETPRQLWPEQKTIIAAELEAAKVIKKWNHFDPARVFGMPKCDPQKFLLLRFFIPPSGA